MSSLKEVTSPSSANQEGIRTIYLNNPEHNNLEKYLHNSISTSKYNTFTFLPKFLWTTAVPLGVVLFATAIKEVMEDLKRHAADGETNSRPCKVLQGTAFIPRPWRTMCVGDIVRIEGGESIPADLVLISSSEPEGMCYIETSNLDGETNLKIKQALPETASIVTPLDAARLAGSIRSEQPNNSLYTFEGTLLLSNTNGNSKELPLDPTQILLRGAQLRNTTWIYGVVVFTGHETKLMRNASATPIKRTSVEEMTNTQILFLFVILLIMSLVSAIGNWVINNGNIEELSYIEVTTTSFGDFIKNILTFLILYNNLIPISLMVTMEVVKFYQAQLINSDLDMYYEKTDTPALARTSSLVEELGQIEYIFSDKTGTLTCNEMEFRQCSIAGLAYSDVVEDGKQAHIEDGVEVGVHDFKQLDSNLRNHPTSNVIDEFLTLLAVCHTVIPERQEDSAEIVYQASSPDEGALVSGAALLGYQFTARRPRSVNIQVGIHNLEYEILNVCEFNSTRKRMSTIVRGPDRKIKLYCKGADTVILERLNPENEFVSTTLQHLEDYATEGLRTLCLAMREIPEGEYEQWSQIYDRAATTIQNRGEELDNAAELIEKNMFLLGATAIEDKLQDGVPETIHTLQQAGIKVWVLTGDRQETAINIGYSCKLIQEDMSLIVCNEASHWETKEFLEDKVKAIKSTYQRGEEIEPLALIIDGKSLGFALEKDIEKVFLELAVLCKAVVCCRVSPLQKALVVKLVKKNLKAILLAIGDGANDVSMIQAAHVGVGISGLEGLQAARSADFAISQFRYLKKLLLVHGAWSYQRLSKLILYSFYKNICLYTTQFWFAFYNEFSGQTAYESWTISLYNVVLTVLPPLSLGIFDQYVSARMLDRYPQMYMLGQKSEFFNVKNFWGWAFNAIFHSIILFFCVVGIFKNDFISSNGTIGGMWVMSVTLYTAVLATVLLKAALVTDLWTKYAYISIPGSMIFWIGFFPLFALIGASTGLTPDYHNITGPVYGQAVFWLTIIFLPILCNLRDYTYKYVKRTFYPRTYHYVQEIQKLNIPDYRPRMERFRKAVHKVRTIQRMRRNRGFAFSQNESGTARLIRAYDTTAQKPQPPLKHVAVVIKKKSTTTRKKNSSKVTKEPISTKSFNQRNIKDGKDHHVIEADGRDHHHIWYGDTKEPKVGNLSSKNGSSNGDEFTLRDGKVVHHLPTDSNTPTIQSNHKRASMESSHRERPSSISGNRASHNGTKSKKIRRIRFDIPNDSDASAISDNNLGIDHDLGMPSITTSFGSDSGDSGFMSIASRAERARVYFSSFFQSSDEDASNTLFEDAAELLEPGENSCLGELNLLSRGMPKGSVDLQTMAEKSKHNLHNARNAIASFDQDVALLRNQLNAKEEALKSAQAKSSEPQQSTAHTEELKNEIFELESTILSLRSELSSMEKDQQKSKRKIEKNEQEIAKLTTILKSKEGIQQDAEKVRNQLDGVNSQCASLIVQIHELGSSLSDRESELSEAQWVIKNLEQNNKTYSNDAQKATSDLESLKEQIVEREGELEYCLKKIEGLTSAQDRVQELEQQLEVMRDQLSTSEGHLNEVELVNKNLNDDTSRAEQLTNEVRILKAHIKDSEWHLNDTMSSLKDLSASKDRVEILERELKEMNKQASVQEKHLQYLENALKAHEHCSNETIRVSLLEEQLDELREQADIKEKHLNYLETALKDHEKCAVTLKHNADLENDVEFLRTQIRVQEKHLAYLESEQMKREGYETKLQRADEELIEMQSQATIRERHLDYLENALHAHESCESEIQELHNNIAALTAQLSEMEAELDSAAKILGDAEAENDAANVEIQAKDDTFMHIKEKAESHIVKISSTASILRTEVESLREQVKVLQREKEDIEAVVTQSAKDFANASTTASKLVVEVESLREKLNQKENELATASEIASQLEDKSNQIKNLLQKVEKSKDASKIFKAEVAATEAQLRFTINAKQEHVKMLNNNLDSWEIHEVGWINRTRELSNELVGGIASRKIKDKAIKDLRYMADDKNLEINRLNDAINFVSSTLRESRKSHTKELHEKSMGWEAHDDQWVAKASDLTCELSHSLDVIRQKEKIANDLQQKARDQDFEIARLNDALDSARTELRENRKRRASEIEDQTKIRTHNLNMTISDLEDHIIHLRKKIRLDEDHMTDEISLGEQIRGLTFWKQNAVEQTKEWETTVSNLESEKVELLAKNELQIKLLEAMVNDADYSRQHAEEKAEKLAKKARALEDKLEVLKGERHANIELTRQIQSLSDQINLYDLQRDELQQEIQEHMGQAAEFEERRREDVSSYKARLIDACDELEIRDKEINTLNWTILELNRCREGQELRIAADGHALMSLERIVSKLRNTLVTQVEKYKMLEKKQSIALKVRDATNNQQERYLAQEIENEHGYLRKNHQLEEKYKKALQRIKELEIEAHSSNRKYHTTLSQLKNIQAQVSN
ncbi:hypothetical protein BGZ76_010179 [Entomortierella beljakovae]|nr:hypothetical protein BGZ76_010179 [Entomortierella beljakovae]